MAHSSSSAMHSSCSGRYFGKCSYIEANVEEYMEKVADLLEKNPAKRPQGGLKVREDKKRGVFVQGL